jgi:hypothetical protein
MPDSHYQQCVREQVSLVYPGTRPLHHPTLPYPPPYPPLNSLHSKRHLRHSEKPSLHSHDNIGMIYEPTPLSGISSRRCVLFLVLIHYLGRLGEGEEDSGVD